METPARTPPLGDAAAFRRFVRALSLDEVTVARAGELLRLLRRGDGRGPPVASINPSVASIARYGVPTERIGAFLDAILLAHATAEDESQEEADGVDSAAFFARFKPRSSNQVLCGYLFQRNDIVFNCKTCQADETCVLCLKCFQNGNHEGHDVFFHRTSPGGVCDCGDSEAWAPDGFCIHHGQRNNKAANGDGDGASASASGSMPLPPSLLRVADALFEAIVGFCVEMAQRSIHTFDPERVDSQGRHMLHAVRAQLQHVQPAQSVFSPFSAPASAAATVDERQFHVRICNDDVHSDEDLIRSLNQKRIPNAEDLVRAIDSTGSELVSVNLALRQALTLMQELKAEGWHVSVVHDQHIHDENVLLEVSRWIKRICSLSKPLHELFCDKLFAVPDPDAESLVAPKEPIQIMFLSDAYFRKDIVLELYELYLKLQGDKDPKLKFSIVFMKVYNRMMLKYFCGIGTREESLFQYGVQILTTPSIVKHLAGMGLLETLLDTINTALDLAKLTTTPISPGVASTASSSTWTVGRTTVTIPSMGGRTSSHHLGRSGRLGVSPNNIWRTLDCEHPLLKFRRYYFVIEHLSYVLGIPSMCSELLLRQDLLRKWFNALNLIQGLDPQVRIQEGCAHVTYETQTWLTAFSFHSNVSRNLALLAKGLRYHESADVDGDKEKMVYNILACFWEQLDHFGIPEDRFQLFTPPLGSLTGLPRHVKIVKFDVGTQPVSFHNALHNLVACFLIETLYYGPSLLSSSIAGQEEPGYKGAMPWISDWKALIGASLHRVYGDTWEDGEQKQELLEYGMFEYPLRTLVLCAQVHCGLWIRNGQNMQRQVINYITPPWSSELRDLDLFIVQVSAAIVGFQKFLTVFFDRFGLSEWLLTWIYSRNDSSTGDDSRLSHSSRDSKRSGAPSTAGVSAPDEKLASLFEAALVNLIWIVTELTVPLQAIEEHDTVLRREIVHRLSQQPCRLSELLDQTTFVVSTPFGGFSARPKQQHLARVEQILDEVAEEQSKRGAASGDDYDDDDDAHGNSGMEPVRYELKKDYYREYDPAFYHLSRSGHEKAQFARQEALFKNWKVEDTPIPLVSALPPAHVSLRPVRLMVLERALLGILRLILEDATDVSSSPTSNGTRTNVMVILRAVHLLNLLVLVLREEREEEDSEKPSSASAWRDGVLVSDAKRQQTLVLLRSGPEAFEEESSSPGKKRVKRQEQDESDVDVHMSSDSDQAAGDSSSVAVEDQSIIALLVTFSTDQVQADLETSKSTISAIYWILRELSAMDSTIDEFVDRRVWSSMKKKQASMNSEGLSKAQLKKLHQQRAIEAMLARQKAFAQSQMFSEMEDDDDLEFMDGSGVHGDEHGGASSGNEAPNAIVYRPPPPPDCIICSQKKKGEPVMYIGHAQMTQVTTHALEDRPGEVGGNADSRSGGSSGGGGGAAPGSSAGEAANSGTPPGSSTQPSSSAPSSPMPFPPPIFVSLCGHAVHLHCWRKYFDSVKAQSRFNLEHSQSNIAFDAHYGEFLCPLCQALSSMLVPYVPISPPLTLEDREQARDAMERVFQAKQDTSSILSWLCDELPRRIEALDARKSDESVEGSADSASSDRDDRVADSNDSEEEEEEEGEEDEDEDVADDDDSESLDVMDQDGGERGEDEGMEGVDRARRRAQQERRGELHRDDVRAMKQFAVSFLEAMLRFQPEMATHVTAAMAALKKSFFATGPQLTHLIWSAVATTIASVQLSGMSAAIYTLEMSGRTRRSSRRHRREGFGSFGSGASPVPEGSPAASASTTSSFSSLRITASPSRTLAATRSGPSLKTRVAVSLPESLESQLDPSTPKDDSKLNVLLRSLRRLPLLFGSAGKRRRAFYRAMCAPVAQNLRLALTPAAWKESVRLGAPAPLGQPLLGQDLVYTCVAVCSGMLRAKADVLLTIRAFCVLHMAQVLLQLSTMPAEVEAEEGEGEDEEDSGTAARADGGRPFTDVSSSSDSDVDSRRSLSLTPPPQTEAAAAAQQQLQQQQRQQQHEHAIRMQQSLETLMGELSAAAGIDLVVPTTTEMQDDAIGDEDGDDDRDKEARPPRGTQLRLLFESSCLAFMRQVTLLLRAVFRGESDPDAAWSANLVRSLRLSTDYEAMRQQLGVPTAEQVAEDARLMAYLLRAAGELQQQPFACVPAAVQRRYRQHGRVEPMLAAIDAAVAATMNGDGGVLGRRAVVASNLAAMPPLPLRFSADTDAPATDVARSGNGQADPPGLPPRRRRRRRYRFANVRLVRLAASYTDLHAEVLGRSKCKQTWKMVENPAICLVCAQVLCAGTECCRRRRDGMGACTHHAMTCGAGVGLFFLMRSSSVLLVFGPRSSYFGSPYLDMFGEEDINVRRGRPLFLSAKRMRALQALYASHQLANEVARNRRTSDQYIRTNYY